jgi:hypothetical protein
MVYNFAKHFHCIHAIVIMNICQIANEKHAEENKNCTSYTLPPQPHSSYSPEDLYFLPSQHPPIPAHHHHVDFLFFRKAGVFIASCGMIVCKLYLDLYTPPSPAFVVLSCTCTRMGISFSRFQKNVHDQKSYRTIERRDASVENSIERPRCEQLVPKIPG